MTNQVVTPISGGGASFFLEFKNLKRRFKDFRTKCKQLIDQNRKTPYQFPIIMTDSEKMFFKENLAGVSNYLEFGSGGSTFLTLLNGNIKRLVSVESDAGWLDYLRKWRLISDNENKTLFFNSVYIGKVGEWGVPQEEDKKELFPNYSADVFNTYKDNDLIFIDGRFRVACALQAVLNSSQGTKILIHDYTDRPEYHCIETFLDVVKTVDTMVLFKIKDNINIDDVKDLYDEYKYNSN